MTVCELRSAGIDTWSPCWYVHPESVAAQLMTSRATAGAARGRMLPDPIAGHRVGWHAGSGMIYAEGHPAAVRGGDGLAAPSTLPEALSALSDALALEGVPVPRGVVSDEWWADERVSGFGGVRRLDSTADLRMRSSAEGFAVMAGVAAVAARMGRVKADVWMRGGRVQTVALHGYAGRRMLGRFYDKGLESGAAPPGTLLRPEDQRRWAREQRRNVTELTGRYVRDKFVGRFAPLWKASKGVTVAGPMVLAEKVLELVQHDEITLPQAERLCGHLVLEALVESRLQKPLQLSRATTYRRRAELLEHGLVLDAGCFQEVEVDLAGVLEAALDSEAWGAGD